MLIQTTNQEEVGEEETQVEKRLLVGDSWFGSVRSAVEVAQQGHHAVLAVKTAHSRFPKKFLDDTMKEFPGGTWITMRGKCGRTGVELVAIGYKYNSKKVLSFVTTVGAGSTEKGRPYRAKYNDQYGNVCHRDVARPAVISRLFENSNVVDVNNQMRQHALALEECWVTTDGWFRLFTTFVGMTVTDTWFVRDFREKSKGKGMEEEGSNNRKIVVFAGDVAESLIDMAEELEREAARPPPELALCVQVPVATNSPVSSLTGCSNEHRHTKVWLSGNRGRNTLSQSRCMWCSRTENRTSKTKLKCLECDVGFCAEKTGRKCWKNHVMNDGPPPKPITKRRKRGRMIDIVSEA